MVTIEFITRNIRNEKEREERLNRQKHRRHRKNSEFTPEELVFLSNHWKVKQSIENILSSLNYPNWMKMESLSSIQEDFVLPALQETEDEGAKKSLGELSLILSHSIEDLEYRGSPPLDPWWTRNTFSLESSMDPFQTMAFVDEEEGLATERGKPGDNEIPEEDMRKDLLFSEEKFDPDAPRWRSKTYLPSKNWIHHGQWKERRENLLQVILKKIEKVKTRGDFMKAYYYLRGQSLANTARNKGQISHTFINGQVIAVLGTPLPGKASKNTKDRLPTGLDYKRYAQAMNTLNAHGLRLGLVDEKRVKWQIIDDRESEAPDTIPEDAIDAPRGGLFLSEELEKIEDNSSRYYGDESGLFFSSPRRWKPWKPSKPLSPPRLFRRMETAAILHWIATGE